MKQHLGSRVWQLCLLVHVLDYTELLFSVTGARTGAGFCWAGLVAGLWVGQPYGVFYQPGFGLAVPALRSLSTQPPFATQALMHTKIDSPYAK